MYISDILTSYRVFVLDDNHEEFHADFACLMDAVNTHRILKFIDDNQIDAAVKVDVKHRVKGSDVVRIYFGSDHKPSIAAEYESNESAGAMVELLRKLFRNVDETF